MTDDPRQGGRVVPVYAVTGGRTRAGDHDLPIEAVVTAMAIQRNLMPPTINLENPDAECDLDYIPNKARDRKVTYAMSNSFGFGGHNASLLFRKLA